MSVLAVIALTGAGCFVSGCLFAAARTKGMLEGIAGLAALAIEAQKMETGE